MRRIAALTLVILTGCHPYIWYKEGKNPKPHRYPPEPVPPYVSACSPVPTQLCGYQAEFSAGRETECFTHVLTGEGYLYVCSDGKQVRTNHGCGHSCARP